MPHIFGVVGLVLFLECFYECDCVEEDYHMAFKNQLIVTTEFPTEKKKTNTSCLAQPKNWALLLKKTLAHIIIRQSIVHGCEIPPVICHRRGHNPRDSLVHAKVKSVKKNTQALLKPLPNGCYKYRVCAQYNNAVKCNYFTHPILGKSILSMISSCSSPHVIYMNKCICGLAYVGKTSHS